MYDTLARRTAEQVHAAYVQRVEAARSDARLTEEHRRRLLAFAYVTTRDRLKTLAAEHTAEVDAERLRLQQSVFGHPADPDALRSALSSATTTIQTREQAEQALRRSSRTNDDVGALAVFNIAAEHGWTSVTKDYLAKRPDAAAADSALRAHEQAGADVNEKLFGPLKFPSLPPELSKHRNHLEQLASEAGEPSPGSPFLPIASR